MKYSGKFEIKKKLNAAFENAFRAFAVWLLSLIARVKFRAVKVLEDGALDEKAVLLGSHLSIWDFCFLEFALAPRRVRFVATSIEFEKNRAYAWMLRALGVIPKMQGAADAACVRAMLRAGQAGDVVAFYPQGMTSHDGRPAWRVQPGTGKLVRMMGASVYVALSDGSFLSHPRYAHASFRGRVEVHVKRLLTAEEARALTGEEVQARIEEALNYNEWTWQEQARVPFYPRKRVKGVTHTLYMCPDCRVLGGMEEVGKTKVHCKVCGMTAERDQFGFFHALSGSCPTRMDEWVDIELDRLREEMKKDDFALCAPVTLMRPTGRGAGYASTDEGQLTLTVNELNYMGQKENITWKPEEFQYFVMNDVDFLHIYAVNGAYRFRFADPRLITRWFYAQRMMSEERT